MYWLLAILSGLFTGLSFNHPHFSFLIWFSFSPLIYIVYKARKPQKYFFIAGLVHYSIVLFWLSHVTRLGLVFLTFYLPLYWFLFGYMAKFLAGRKAAVLTLPALWVLGEFLRENAFIFSFGWAVFGYSQYTNAAIVQVADIFGVKFISFIILTVNCLWAGCLIKEKRSKDLIYTVLILFLSFSYSVYKLRGQESTRIISLDVVQPNIPQEIKWDSFAEEFIVESLSRLGGQARDNALVVYPEASWPLIIDFNRENKHNNLAIEAWTKKVNRDVLIGVIIREKDNFYNTAMRINKSGEIEGVYRKIKLVPFGEYVPLRKIFGSIEALSVLGDMSAGKSLYSFNCGGKKFGVIICFEDTFGRFVSDFARDNDFLINITNDAWFGGQPQARQHLAVMTLRAVENRISIIRSANTGVSGYVDYLGNIGKLTYKGKDVFIEGIFACDLPLNSRRSFYNRWGELFPVLCLFLVIGGCINNSRLQIPNCKL
ncbi:MAG: apolipoprotein N-acyltransferase [Candidatus Omnitrophota bacterium]